MAKKDEKYKEVELLDPTNLDQVNIAFAMIVLEELGKEVEKDPMVKIIRILSRVNNVPEASIRGLPIEVVDELGGRILNLFLASEGEYDIEKYRRITIEGTEFALVPSLTKVELGAFIDLSEYFKESIHSVLHKIMAILYRPVTSSFGYLYEVSSYSDETPEVTKARADLFLRAMPYSITRGVVNFILAST